MASLRNLQLITGERRRVYGSEKETICISNSKRIHTNEEENKKTVNLTKEKNTKPSSSLQIYFHIADRECPPRALAVLPTALQYIRGHIFTRRPLPPRVRFGPVQGVTNQIFHCEGDELISEAAAAKKPVFLMRRNEDCVTHIDVSNKERSNWLSLLPLAANADIANVWLYEHENELYGITTKMIPLREHLALGYSEQYVEEHGLPAGPPVLDLEAALSEHEQKWWCFECRRAFPSASILQRHVSVFHREKPARRRYRCAFCSKAFTRISSLRRHTAEFCPKNRKQSEETMSNSQEEKQLELTQAKNTDESRIPSDESLQLYTTGLDLSTNLFDPDKIANLDISNCSEGDFNYYSGALKFDDFEKTYTSFAEGLQIEEENKDKDSAVNDEHIIVNCQHCNQTMTKAKKRRHVRECGPRVFKCECNRLFRRHQDFAQHIFTAHNELAKKSAVPGDSNAQDKKLQLQCDHCKINFKRRGMLVNHLFRVHNVTASLPVERRELYYPCTACLNIYRSAAKRDAHVRKKHPGVTVRAAPIEGQKKTYEAAKCSMCPRQYVTKAKLLQHMRSFHLATGASTNQQQSPSRSLLKDA